MTKLQTAQAIWDLAAVTLLIGVAYVFVLAPVALSRGDAPSWHDYAAGCAGVAFWIATSFAVTEVLGL